MKMSVKKKISLALALLMSVSMLATGCKKTDEDTAGLADTLPCTSTVEITEELPSLTQMTEAETEKETEAETTAESEEETAETTVETTVPETTADTTEAPETTTVQEWNETAIDQVMYTTENCYARKIPKLGAETVKQYLVGTEVKIVAHTDTGYYKLEDGSFIHEDYLSEEKPAETTTAKPETTKPQTTKKPETEKPQTTTETEATKPLDTNVDVSVEDGKFKNRYGYKTLNAAQKELYANIVKAAEKLERNVNVPDGLMSEDIMKVYGMVFNQEPQLFWLSRTVPSGYGSIRLDYTVGSIEERDAMQAEIDKNAKAVLAAANQYSNTFSKLKVFYDWIITNAEFSVSESTDTCAVYNGMTGGKNLQCVGYAKTMMYLCDLAGIECMTITGKNDEGSSHAWKFVYCDDGYYNLDTAWGDPMNEHNSKYVRYNFFLVPDAWIKNDHLSVNLVFRSNGSSIKYFDPPACTKTSCNYFKSYKKEYSSVESAAQAMYDELEAAIKAGRNVAHIRVTDAEIWETLHSTDYAKKFQNFAKEKGNVAKLARQKRWSEGVLVVQYDIFYN